MVHPRRCFVCDKKLDLRVCENTCFPAICKTNTKVCKTYKYFQLDDNILCALVS